MSDLVGNPEDQFYSVAAHLLTNIWQIQPIKMFTIFHLNIPATCESSDSNILGGRSLLSLWRLS